MLFDVFVKYFPSLNKYILINTIGFICVTYLLLYCFIFDTGVVMDDIHRHFKKIRRNMEKILFISSFVKIDKISTLDPLKLRT